MAKLSKVVADKVRFYRKAAKLTQEDLSEMLGIDRSYIGKIERAEVNISLDTVERIASALKIEPFALFEIPYKSFKKDKKDMLERINSELVSQEVDELKVLYEIIIAVRKYKDIEEV